MLDFCHLLWWFICFHIFHFLKPVTLLSSISVGLLLWRWDLIDITLVLCKPDLFQPFLLGWRQFLILGFFVLNNRLLLQDLYLLNPLLLTIVVAFDHPLGSPSLEAFPLAQMRNLNDRSWRRS